MSTNGKLIADAGKCVTGISGKVVGNDAIVAVLAMVWTDFERAPYEGPLRGEESERVRRLLFFFFFVIDPSDIVTLPTPFF